MTDDRPGYARSGDATQRIPGLGERTPPGGRHGYGASGEGSPAPGSYGPSAGYRPPAGTSTMSRPDAADASTARPVRRGPRRARLAVKRVEPWSVLKLSFAYSLALLVVFLVAVTVLYGVLTAMGVFDSIDRFVHDLNTNAADLASYISFGSVFFYALVIGLVNVVLMTALSTLGAFLYNLCSDIVGGVEVTLTERD